MGAITTVLEVPEDHTIAVVGAKLPVDPNLMGMMQQLQTTGIRLEKSPREAKARQKTFRGGARTVGSIQF